MDSGTTLDNNIDNTTTTTIHNINNINDNITVSKESITFTSPKKVFYIPSDCFVFHSKWLILSKKNIVKFINIEKRRLEFLQIVEFEVDRLVVEKNILIYFSKNLLPKNSIQKNLFSILLDSPTPPKLFINEVEKPIDYILKIEKLIDNTNIPIDNNTINTTNLIDNNTNLIDNTNNPIDNTTLRVLNSNLFSIFKENISTLYSLDFKPIGTFNFPLVFYFEENGVKLLFSSSSLFVYKEDVLVYEFPLEDYLTVTVSKNLVSKNLVSKNPVSKNSSVSNDLPKNCSISSSSQLIYIGYSNYIMVYKIGKKTLLKKYKIFLESKPLKMEIFGDLLLVSLFEMGLCIFKGNELVKKDKLSRSITNILIKNNKIFCTSPRGLFYVYDLDLNPLASIYIGKCIGLYWKESIYFVTNRGEIGEIIEIDGDTSKTLKKVEDILKENGKEYFPSFPKINFYNSNYLKEILNLENVKDGELVSTVFEKRLDLF